MPVDPLSALIKPGLDLVKTGIAAMRRQLGKRKADQVTSAVIAELLKQSPDITAAEAQLAAIEATGARPTVELHRAKKMLGAVRHAKTSAATGRWVGRRRASGRRSSSKKSSRPRSTRATGKRKA